MLNSKLGNVLLGYSDGEQTSQDSTNIFINKLGGLPNWIKENGSYVYPDSSVATCTNCASHMVLLCQLYVPLDNSPYERFIYLWGCSKMSCIGTTGSFKALRGHQMNKQYLKTILQKTQSQPNTKRAKVKPSYTSRNQPAQGKKHTLKLKPQVLDFGSIWEDDSKNLGVEASAIPEIAPEKPETSIFDNTKSLNTVLAQDNPKCSDIIKNSGETQSKSEIKPQCKSYDQKNAQAILKINQNSKPKEECSNKESSVSNNNNLNTNRFEKLVSHSLWPSSIPYLKSQYLEIEPEYLESPFHDLNANINKSDAVLRILESTSSPHKSSSGAKSIPTDAKVDPEVWAGEKYEHSILPKGVDAGFQNFVSIVSQNPEQCLRYQFGGTPLLYSITDSTSNILGLATKKAHNLLEGPSKSSQSTSIHQDVHRKDLGVDIKAIKPSASFFFKENHKQVMASSNQSEYFDQIYQTDDDEDDEDFIPTYNYCTDQLPKCPMCKSPRVFEFQVMPPTLSFLDTTHIYNSETETDVAPDLSRISLNENSESRSHKTSDIQDRLAGSKLLNSLDIGMEFGTILVFTCQNDCHSGNYELQSLANEADLKMYSNPEYYEEVVLVQYESHLD